MFGTFGAFRLGVFSVVGVFRVFTGVFWGEGGHVCVVGFFWRHWASVLDVLGLFGVPK